MRPGITGLWKVEARHDPDFDRWVERDLAYIDSWSPWLDIVILLPADDPRGGRPIREYVVPLDDSSLRAEAIPHRSTAARPGESKATASQELAENPAGPVRGHAEQPHGVVTADLVVLVEKGSYESPVLI